MSHLSIAVILLSILAFVVGLIFGFVLACDTDYQTPQINKGAHMNKDTLSKYGIIYQDTDTIHYQFTDKSMNPVKYNEVSCDFFSLMLTDGTVSDFTDCRARDGLQGIEILTKDNTLVYYYHHFIKGYTYKIKTFNT